jgi:hypothetical protein
MMDGCGETRPKDRGVKATKDAEPLNKSPIKQAVYHCSDFDFQTWADECTATCALPAVQIREPRTRESAVSGSHETTSDAAAWDKFYDMHATARVYKPRRYIFPEFESRFTEAITTATESMTELTLFEIGCGHGCTMFPLIRLLQEKTRPAVNADLSSVAFANFRWHYWATDCSREALHLISSHHEYSEVGSNVSLAVYNCENTDVIVPVLGRQAVDAESQAVKISNFEGLTGANVSLCIFTLSAVSPDLHIQCLKNIYAVMSPGSVLLFRDYAVHDMTMYRHTIRLGSHLFERPEGTLAYYFDKKYLSGIACKSGFEVEEVEYACVTIRNRQKLSAPKPPQTDPAAKRANSSIKKDMTCMNRVFIHAVFRKPL